MPWVSLDGLKEEFPLKTAKGVVFNTPGEALEWAWGCVDRARYQDDAFEELEGGPYKSKRGAVLYRLDGTETDVHLYWTRTQDCECSVGFL